MLVRRKEAMGLFVSCSARGRQLADAARRPVFLLDRGVAVYGQPRSTGIPASSVLAYRSLLESTPTAANEEGTR